VSRTGVAWLVLIVGGLLEIAWASLIREANWLDRPLFLIAGLALSLVSVLMLGWAMRLIPLGTGYAAWIGIGAAGSVIAGIIFFGESASLVRLLLIVAVLAGIIGLQFSEGEAVERRD
jgi:quaternary ammonium compound-resistance protein SugE